MWFDKKAGQLEREEKAKTKSSGATAFYNRLNPRIYHNGSDSRSLAVCNRALAENIFHFAEQRSMSRAVLNLGDAFQLLQKFAMPLAQLLRSLHVELHKQIPLAVAI
jgi:hypothetical protein